MRPPRAAETHERRVIFISDRDGKKQQRQWRKRNTHRRRGPADSGARSAKVWPILGPKLSQRWTSLGRGCSQGWSGLGPQLPELGRRPTAIALSCNLVFVADLPRFALGRQGRTHGEIMLEQLAGSVVMRRKSHAWVEKFS